MEKFESDRLNEIRSERRAAEVCYYNSEGAAKNFWFL